MFSQVLPVFIMEPICSLFKHTPRAVDRGLKRGLGSGVEGRLIVGSAVLLR